MTQGDSTVVAGRPRIRWRQDRMISVLESNKLGRGVMTWRKLLAAMTALAAMLVIMTASPPSYARELQRLETATPEQVGMSSARLERITEALKKEDRKSTRPKSHHTMIS